MSSALLLAVALLASPPAAGGVPKGPAGPKGPIVIETSRGKLEFNHEGHSKTPCADCHKAEGPAGKIGVKGLEAAHKFCRDCHLARKKGPQGCTSCHALGGTPAQTTR